MSLACLCVSASPSTKRDKPPHTPRCLQGTILCCQTPPSHSKHWGVAGASTPSILMAQGYPMGMLQAMQGDLITLVG